LMILVSGDVPDRCIPKTTICIRPSSSRSSFTHSWLTLTAFS
jgi:hypothetical protein